MKALLLLTAGGPMMVISMADLPTAPGLLKELASKGIEKFIAYEIPVELAKARYGAHFDAVANDTHESDDLHILDFNGQRIFQLFRFDEWGAPVRYEAPAHHRLGVD